MAKLDAYKFTGGQPDSSVGGVATTKIVTTFTNANVKALGNINRSVISIDQTLKGLYSVSMASIKNDKLREQAERRRAQRERDAAREDEIESGMLPRSAASMAKTGKLTKKEEGWASQLFKSMFGGLGFLMQGAFQFLASLATFAAVRSILEIIGNPENRAKMELFFTKLQFVWNKISSFTSWLVKDNLLDGFTSLFGENKTFGERLQGLGKLLIGIIGLKILLNPFGLLFGVLDLLNAREAAANRPQSGGKPGGPAKPGGTQERRIPPTRKRDIILKRSRVDRLGRLKTSLQRIKARQAGIVDYARVGVRRPGRLPGFAAQGLKQTPRAVLNGFKSLARGARNFIGRIPVVGTLINFVFNILDVDEQGNLKLDIVGKGEKAAYQSIGAAIGAAAGSFVPVPVLGTIVGGILGDYGGELIYDMVKGASGASVMAKMKTDFGNTIRTIQTGAGAAAEWIGGAWNKWYAGVDKVKMPSYKVFGREIIPFAGNLIPDPKVLMNPAAAALRYGGNFFKALFGGIVEIGKTTNLFGGNVEQPSAPGAGSTGTGQVTPAGSGVGSESELFDLIGAGEGGYNSINNGTAGDRPGGAKRWLGKNLTDMTLNELMQYQKSKVWAAGKYQIIPGTMAGFVNWLRGKGYNPATTRFSEQIQELFPKYVLESKRPAVGRYLRGQASVEEANLALAAEFASVGVPYAMKKGSFNGTWPKVDISRGMSLYSGAGGNRASITPEEIQAALKRLKSGGGAAPSTSNLGTQPVQQASNNQWWDFLNVFPDGEKKESSVPGRPIGQKATLNGKPVVWDGDNWVPDEERQQDLATGFAMGAAAQALMKGVLALPQSNAQGLSPLPQTALEGFIKAVKNGQLSLYLAPDGIAAAGAALNAGANLLDAAGNFVAGAFGGGAGTTGDAPGGAGGAGDDPYDRLREAFDERLSDPYNRAYSRPELDDPIGEYLRQAYPDPPADGPSGAPYSQPLTKEGILNNFYGYNPLSVSDGIKIAMAKMGLGGGKKEESTTYGDNVKTTDIDFSSLFNFSSGGSVPKNLPQAFFGKIFKGIKKFVGGIVKGVTNAVKSVGSALSGFLNSPIGQIVSFGLSFTPLAPIVAGVKAVVALTQGDILGAIVGGMGALGGAFPGTFGEGGTFFQGLNKTFGEGLGGVMGGFLTGGFGGAIGALPGLMPAGLQNIFKGIGGFLEENQGVASVIQMLPGLAGATGFAQMLGLPQPAAMGGLGTLTSVAEEGGAGAVLQAILGTVMGTKGFQDAIGDIASELGVNPEALGGILSRSRMTNPLDEKSRELALQSSIEIQQMPIVIEKLVEIPKGIPINNYIPVKSQQK